MSQALPYDYSLKDVTLGTMRSTHQLGVLNETLEWKPHFKQITAKANPSTTKPAYMPPKLKDKVD